MNKAIEAGRRAGKTTALLERLWKINTDKVKVFVSPSFAQARVAMELFSAMLKEQKVEHRVSLAASQVAVGGEVIEFTSFERFIDPSFARGIETTYCIDELEACINWHFHSRHQMLGVSVLGSEIEENK